MSKNITIQEGGIGKQLTVDKLKTDLVGGGSCLWVPEDEGRLTTKYISENGTYKASDDGYYGYSEVTVSGVGTASGKDPDGSGDDAAAYTDPETGDLVIAKLPSSIEVITPPTNPYGTYQDGQTITKDGMVVKAYLESGGEYGTVPNGEITLNPTTAVYDASKDQPAGGEKSSDLVTGFVQPIPYQSRFEAIFPNDDKIEISGADGFIAYHTNVIQNYIAAGKNPGTYTMTRINASDPAHPITSQYNLGSTPFIRDGKSVYYAEIQAGPHPAGGEATRKDDEVLSVGGAAWTIMYGEGEERPAGSTQTITVLWPRPHDGKVLETTFEIRVAPGYTPNGED